MRTALTSTSRSVWVDTFCFRKNAHLCGGATHSKLNKYKNTSFGSLQYSAPQKIAQLQKGANFVDATLERRCMDKLEFQTKFLLHD